MERIKANEIRQKMVINIGLEYFRVISCDYNQNCQREPTVNLVLRDIYNGNKKNHRCGAHDDLSRIHIYEERGTYSYNDGEIFFIINDATYDMIEVPITKINKANFLVSNCPVSIVQSEDLGIICIDVASVIQGKIDECQDSDKHKKAFIDTGIICGNNGGAKASITAGAKSGITIIVPSYVKVGDIIEINTDEEIFIRRI